MDTDGRPFGNQPLQRLDKQSVHNIRKGTKQLRAHLQLLRQLEGQHHETEELRNAVKELARLLASQRDTDVMAGLLQELITATEDLEEQQLLGTLLSELQCTPMPADDMKRVRKLVKEIEKKTPRLLHTRRNETEINRVLQLSLATLCATGRELLAHDDWEALHDWRKQVKKLMYQYQLKASLTPEDLFVMERLNQLGNGLGNINDLTMLKRYVNTHQSRTTRAHDLDVYSRVHGLIATRRNAELDSCRAEFRAISNLQ